MIEIHDPKFFFELQSSIISVPYTQSEAWHDYKLSKGEVIRYFIDSRKKTSFSIWGIEKKIPFLRKKLFLIEGESYHNQFNESQFASFFRFFKDLNYDAVLINSINSYDVEYEIGIRRSGFVRPLYSTSCPLTLIVNIQGINKYNRNWKRNVKTAIDQKLDFIEIIDPNEIDIEVFIYMFQEMSKLKKLKYTLYPQHLLCLTKNKHIRFFLVKKDNRPVAARIIYQNEKNAFDVYAANSKEARNNGASYFLMEKIFELLKIEGVEDFDFGRIPPSTKESDNVYLFKKASGGFPLQYNGEWVLYRNFFTEILLSLYKVFITKNQRY